MTENTVTENTVTENTVTENTATENTATENPSQPNNNKPNTENKQNTVPTKQADGSAAEISVIFSQINGEALRESYGADYTEWLVRVIADCRRAKSRTVGGEAVDGAELCRVFGMVCEQDVRGAVEAVRGKPLNNPAGYFGSVLYNLIKRRTEQPQLKPRQEIGSSIPYDEIMDSIMARYRDPL